MSICLSTLDIRSEFVESHDEYLSIGVETASSSNVLFIGLARNLESKLNQNIEHIYSLKNLFKNLDVFIYENDSIDDTSAILEVAHKKYNLHYISENLDTKQYGSVKVRERVRLLSDYRNKCITKINQLISNNIIINPDYVIVIDLDFKQYSKESIIHSIGWMNKNPQTKACAGNAFEPKIFGGSHNITWNYDSWAFRLNWWEDLQNYNTSSTIHQDLMYWFGLWIPPVGSDPIRVNSAFGGSCIYKSNYYLSGKYDCYDCEHVCFHKYLYDNFKDFELRLNPAQIMIF